MMSTKRTLQHQEGDRTGRHVLPADTLVSAVSWKLAFTILSEDKRERRLTTSDLTKSMHSSICRSGIIWRDDR